MLWMTLLVAALVAASLLFEYLWTALTGEW